MNNKPEAFAGIGGLIGIVASVTSAFGRYDFTQTDQIQQAVGYVLGGFAVGALVGYFIGKAS